MKQYKNKGFTLIELLIVIAIIAVLASATVATLSTSRLKAEDAAKAATIIQLSNALELYANAHQGTYPVVLKETESYAAATFENRTSTIGSLFQLIIPIAYAADPTPNELCENTNTVISLLASEQYLTSTFGNDPSDPFCIRTRSSGSTLVIYAPLKTQTYANGINKQVGKVFGDTETESVEILCKLIFNGGYNGFPIRNSAGVGIDACEGTQSADKILGMTEGIDLPFDPDAGSCSDPTYTTEATCEEDHSSCSGGGYTNETDCESNGGTVVASCSGGAYYIDETSCTTAGYYPGSCSGGGHTTESSCTGDGYTSGGSCSGGGFTTESECVNATYPSGGSCSGGGHTDESSCTGAGYTTSPSCSNGYSSTQEDCEAVLATWDSGGTFVNYGYTWNPTYTSYGYTWTPGIFTYYGYTWAPNGGTFTSSGYTWTPESYTPYVWNSASPSTWTPAN